jgi:hypothetical protein
MLLKNRPPWRLLQKDWDNQTIPISARTMRGADTFTDSLFEVRKQDFVPVKHPLCAIREMAIVSVRRTALTGLPMSEVPVVGMRFS